MRRLAARAVVASALAVAGSLIYAISADRSVVDMPASIASDCSRPVQDELAAFLNGVEPGLTVRFAPGGCYLQDRRLMVDDRTDLVLDGQGATLRSVAPNLGGAVEPNLLLFKSDHIEVYDLRIVGNFHPHPPAPRSQQRAIEMSEDGSLNQFNPGIGIYGGTDVTIRDTDIRNVYGDGVLTAVSYYLDGLPAEIPTDVVLERVVATTTARHCYAPTTADGFTLRGSVGRDCWYWAVDAELDTRDYPMRRLRFINNTFSDYFTGGLTIPVSGVQGDHIEIRGNRFLTPSGNQDAPGPYTFCNQTILVGADAYQSPYHMTDVVIEDNEIHYASAVVIEVDRVNGGRIRNNRLIPAKTPSADVHHPNACGTPNLVKLSNSTDVVVHNNGRDATASPTPTNSTSSTSSSTTSTTSSTTVPP